MQKRYLIITQLRETIRRSDIRSAVVSLMVVSTVILCGIVTGVIGGIRQGKQLVEKNQVFSDVQALFEQYTLGLGNMEREEFDLARQRFEYILTENPDFPGASEKLLEVLNILYATATPSPIPPTPTPTKEVNTQQAEELFVIAYDYFVAEDWYSVIDTIIKLRNVDLLYRVVEVDGLLYTALRNQGVQKIRSDNDLAGGIYNLALAERFGPIDVEANNWRNLARLYLFGLSFWEVIPERAVYYFSHVASAAPYLRDASGWTAIERYRIALVLYADLLASQGDWCEAQRYYEDSLSIGFDNRIRSTAQFVTLLCSPPTQTPTITLTQTATPTLTGTIPPPIVITETQTQTIMYTPTATETPTVTATIYVTAIPSTTPTPSPSNMPTNTVTTTPQLNPSLSPTPSVTLSTQ